MSEDDIKTVLQTQLTLKLMHFDHLEGSPSQVYLQSITTYIHLFPMLTHTFIKLCRVGGQPADAQGLR